MHQQAHKIDVTDVFISDSISLSCAGRRVFQAS